MTTLLRLPPSYSPWRYALRIEGVDSVTFHKFIESLKTNIPPKDRKWDARERCWLLDDYAVIVSILNKFRIDYDTDFIEDDESEPEPEPTHRRLTTTAAYETFYLLPTAPEFIVQAVYRAMVKKYHPDAGGDTATMQKINAAMEVLK